MIALYHPCEKIKDSTGNTVTQVKAVGYCLPTSSNLRYDMLGHWSKNPKFGVQFEVESYNEVVIPTKEGIIAYLSSGQIKGIGPKIAEKIYAVFGQQSLEVLDKEPERLLAIPGISEIKLKKIYDSYLVNRGARDVVAFLSPHGITPNRAVRLYKEYGEKTMDIVKNHPYQLCDMAGIGFKTADHIAMSMGFDQLSTERVDEGLLYTLADAEAKGHLCMEKHEFVKACLKILDTPALTLEMVANRAARLVFSGQLVSYQGNVYRSKTAHVEEQLASAIHQQMKHRKMHSYGDLDAAIDAEEQKLKMKFAPEQRKAVKMALTQGLSIITGGPGTGKTLIQRAILDIYQKNNPKSEICCCAPTGRAARRMEQATGVPASTVHKALGLMADEDGDYDGPEALTADLIVVDEISMLDVYLAGYLFDAVKYGAQMVLIGDADQLPSVGPGAVLSEMIASGCIPVVRLDKVFRQNAGSRIATNAKLIRHGNVGLEYGDDFQFINSPRLSDSAKLIVDLYLRETEKYGVDNVALLTPYRQKTETGVNALNEHLREKVNPPDAQKPEVVFGNRKFRCGDKVMQIKNHDDVNNGDIGYIRKIIRIGDDTTVHVDFGDGRMKEYDSSELDMLDLGYASTIHKSQGSEYQSVIINLQCAHSIMLTRPLIYTAITRGKERVTIVGEKRALCISIKRTDTEKRGTCLAKRLQGFA
ncbi:ATP-dependent RecD-like DNA helicase [Enterococcus faecium]|uniref:ATP-dependent RecD2 DNA helicase n=3 Tax=Bacillota TaxID=1239 RepID=A0A8F5V8E2_ENTCA|nr:ATP-dependent RecD-like DNA helicase [Enterococcus faecium]QXO84641.1 ATP-dependent RecD-like DNA helicase [Enterococcus faecium]QXO84783.1 ATP-dependent RecD-like DNA helicase [Enterococcus casseliflavus]